MLTDVATPIPFTWVFQWMYPPIVMGVTKPTHLTMAFQLEYNFAVCSLNTQKNIIHVINPAGFVGSMHVQKFTFSLIL